MKNGLILFVNTKYSFLRVFFLKILYFFNRFRWGSRHRSSGGGGGVMCRERDGRNKFENNNSRNDSDTVHVHCTVIGNG